MRFLKNSKIKILTNASQNFGFTLIELLVVIAIISILAGTLLVVVNPASIQQRSRDSKRMQEMETLRNALIIALSEGEISLVDTTVACGADGCDSSEGGVVVDGTGFVKFSVTGTRGLAKYIPTLPRDPLSTSSYVYASDGIDFELNTVLENADNAEKMTTDGGNSDTTYEMGTSLDIL